MSTAGLGCVLILQEPPMHPNSVVVDLESKFEQPSVIHALTKDILRNYQKPPIYDEKYLVIFESKAVLEGNLALLRLEFMFPVVVCRSNSAVSDVKDICRSKQIPFKIFKNEFKKEDALELIRDLSSVNVSKSFCDTLIRRVGLNPQRIISAIMVCEQVGYETSKISKYIDKHTYIDIYDVIYTLLGVPKSQAQRNRALAYLHQNRLWYRKYTQGVLAKELMLLLRLYSDMLEGKLTPYTLYDYMDANKVARYQVMYAIDLFPRISYNELEALHTFVARATILEVTMRLSL